MKKFFFAVYFGIVFCVAALHAEDREGSFYWFIQEDFVKFGKRELYESQQKLWLSGFFALSRSSSFWRQPVMSFPIIGLQGMEEPQYIYLIPLKDKNALFDYYGQNSLYKKVLEKEKNPLSQMLDSSVNFRISSLHCYLDAFSSVSALDIASFAKDSHIFYWIIAVASGFEDDFEKALEGAIKKNAGTSSLVRRVLRVALGSDTPKYIILFSASSEELYSEAKELLQFTEGSIKDVVRSKKNGKAMIRPELSILKK